MVAAPLALAALERGAVPDRDEHVLERGPRLGWCACASPVRPSRTPSVCGSSRSRGVPPGVAALVRPLELDVEAVAAERARRAAQPRSGRGRRARAARSRRGRRGPRSAPRAALGSSAGGSSSASRPGRRVCRLRLGQQPAEVGVAARALDEQRHVRAARERHLRAGDRPDAEGLGRVRELERAVQAVVVGERERRRSRARPRAAASSSGCEAPSRNEYAE